MKFDKFSNYLLILLLAILLFQTSANAQSADTVSRNVSSIPDNDQWMVGFNYSSGMLIPHATETSFFSGRRTKAYEMLFLWHLNNQKVWGDCHCYPRIGFYFGEYDFSSEDILGHGYSAGLNFEYFFGLPTTFNLYLQGKIGLAYLTNPYDEKYNSENYSYSTHYNYLINVAGGLNIRLLNPITFKIEYGFTHNSNAALTEPNSGINYSSLSVAALLALNTTEFKERPDLDPYSKGQIKNRWDFVFSYGISALPFPLKDQVPMYSVSVLKSNQLFRFIAINFGYELEWNGRAVELTKRNNQYLKVNPLRASALLGIEFLMGRTVLSMQVGGYFYRPFKEKDDFYQRWGLMYKVFDHVYLGFNFKSYRNFADHLSGRMTLSF